MKNFYVYFVSLIGGINLLAFELITSKLIAPIYGTSFHVWAVTLLVTLIGIALGYFLSTKLMNLKRDAFVLILIHMCIAITLFLIKNFGNTFLNSFIESSFLIALIFSVILLFLPIFLFFGTISPLLISLLSKHSENPKKLASIIFSLSTMGGVVGIYLFGFYLIPMKGLNFSLNCVQIINLLNMVILLVLNQFIFKNDK